MPLKTYCPNVECCAPIEYSLNKPLFCPMCGKPLSAVATPKTSTAQTKTVPQQPVPQAEEVVDIDNLTFQGQIEKFSVSQNVQLGDLAQQGKTGFARDIPKRINKKKQIEEFRAEASKAARVDVQDGGAE